jgi:hypothetical protein
MGVILPVASLRGLNYSSSLIMKKGEENKIIKFKFN